MSKKPPTPAGAPTQPANGYNEDFQSPLPGRKINSPFGPRRAPRTGNGRFGSTNHTGVDFAAPEGTAVRASASGVVTFAGRQGGYGLRVVIRHDEDTETTYSHLSTISVSVGQRVTQGQIIGEVGSTGNSSGPHLHFEVVEDGVKINPATVLGQSTNIDLNDTTAAENRKKDEQEASGLSAVSEEELNRRLSELSYNQDEIIRKLISGEHFQDNPANEFKNLTYHWRLFTTVDQDLLTELTSESTMADFYKRVSELKQVTIAETGVTGFNVDGVTITSLVGTDYLSGSTMFQNFEIKITEPNGAIFLDALRNAAVEVGTRNYQKCFYYLELTFKGYREDGSIELKPFANLPNGGKWLWSLILSDIEVNVTAGGGTYTLSMINQNDSFTSSRLNIIPYTVNIKGDTLGQFMDDMCEKLNNYYRVMRGGETIVFKNKFHPIAGLMTADEVRAIPVSYESKEVNESRSEGMSVTNQISLLQETRTAHIPSGFTVADVLDAVLQSCETAQNLVKGTKINAFYVNESSEKINQDGFRNSVLFRVEPEIRHPNYDPIFNEYYKEVTLHIYGFYHHTAVLSRFDTLLETNAQKAIIADLAARNFLRKRYEYLFTGQNTEVLEMDLGFKLNWAALLPRFTDASSDQVAPHAKARIPGPNEQPGIPTDQRPTSEEIATSQTQIAEIGAERQRLSEELARIQAREAAGEITPEEAQAQKAEIQRQVDELKKRYGEYSNLNELRSQLQAERPMVAPSRNYERLYGEALATATIEGEDRKNVFPITTDFVTSDTVTGLSGQYHAGKSIYGAVLNQVYGPMASKLMRQDITIRGDPYWIGPGSFEIAILRASDLFSNEWPNFSQGCNTILFRMAYPLGQDYDGNVILRSDETVTGVYQVTSVTHRFDGGQFTQVLKCIRVPLIDVYKTLFKDINGVNEQNNGQ